MTPADQIRINALLLEREGEFLRVHELEQAAAAILGEPYPFAQPPLPSNQPKRGKARSGKAKAVEAGSVKLRRLEAGERGYRVRYRVRDEVHEEVYPAAEALQTLLAAQGAQLVVERIETVDADGVVQTTLHQAG